MYNRYLMPCTELALDLFSRVRSGQWSYKELIHIRTHKKPQEKNRIA